MDIEGEISSEGFVGVFTFSSTLKFVVALEVFFFDFFELELVLYSSELYFLFLDSLFALSSFEFLELGFLFLFFDSFKAFSKTIS